MTIPLLSILYNDCTGGFRFSDNFLEEYKRRTGEIAPALGGNWRNKQECIRCNPIVIEIFEEKGSQWCSGRNSRIRQINIPAIFTDFWKIEEYHGHEAVSVDVNHALADVLERFMNHQNLIILENEYRVIKEAEQILLGWSQRIEQL